MGCSKSSSKREVYSSTILPQETRKTSNRELNFTLNQLEKEEQNPPKLWDILKAVLRGGFIAIQAYRKQQEKSQINKLTLHLKQLEKEEMKNPRVNRRKEILKIRAEINAK